MSSLRTLIEYKENLVAFFDALIEQFPDEGDFVIFRIYLKDRADMQDVINYFIKNILPLKSIVKRRDERFFLDHNVAFDDADKSKVNHFRRLWRSSRLDHDDKMLIWKWFDTFIFIVEKYQKEFQVESAIV